LGGGTVSDDLRQQQPELSTMYRTWAALKKRYGTIAFWLWWPPGANMNQHDLEHTMEHTMELWRFSDTSPSNVRICQSLKAWATARP
jgi:hypothetical protein